MPKIMVIDDSAMMRAFLRRCLEREGMEVDDWMPQSAVELPERIQASSPELILTDYQMPGCNGATVARMAHQVRPDLPVIVLTACRQEETATALKRLGVQWILDKPISAEALVAVVNATLVREGA